MRLLTIAALLSATGCMTFGDGLTHMTSLPPGALVTVPGAGSCETPCTIKLVRPLDVTVAKAGYVARKVRIEPGQSKAEVKLELAAPTKDVDASEMPELN
jgi:hypothetical protein